MAVEVLTPMCFTLRHLILGENDLHFWRSDDWYVANFTLRHLRLLETMRGLATTLGVHYLNDAHPSSLPKRARIETTLPNERKNKFEEACNEIVSSRSTIHPPPQSTLHISTFAGELLDTNP